MTLGFSLGLSLGAGLYADSGPIVLKRRFEALWGKTEVFVANATPWDLTRQRAWQHHSVWAIRLMHSQQWAYRLRLEGTHRSPYGDMRMHRDGLLVAWADMRRHAHRLWAPWADVAQSRLSHVLAYTDLGTQRQSMQTPYWLTQQIAARAQLGYSVAEVDPLVQRLTASWSILEGVRLQALANNPELIWHEQRIRILEATLSCDEDSPVWMARIGLAAIADFAAIGIGQSITLALGQENFVLVVDGKTLSRTALAEQRMELTAVSPVALLDAPFAAAIRYYEAQAISARAAVEHLIGQLDGQLDGQLLDWQLPDWIIAPGRLMIEGATPLAAARNIVAAIGGIVESNPDGSLVCRLRHPVSIPQYDKAAVAHSLFDADVLAAQSQIAPMRGFNRVTIGNEDSSAGTSGTASERIEYVADADDANRGTVRAYLVRARPVVLTHTGNVATVIASLGAVVRSESETVEFIEGQANTRYPVTSLVDLAWQHTALGEVSATGQSLVAATSGYSLLRITYTTTSLDWRVALGVDEEVQFELVDA